MNIDKSTLNTLASLDDATLSAAIRMIASSSGLNLGSMTFDKQSLEALRTMMRGATDADIANARRIFEGFNHGRKQPE